MRSTSRSLPLALRCLVVVLSTWSLLTVLPDVARVFPGAVIARVPLEVDNAGIVQRVDAGVASSGRLRSGSRIDLAANNCRRGIATDVCSNLMALYGGSGGIQFVTLHHPDILVYLTGETAPVRIRPQPYVDPPLTKALLLADEILALLFVTLAAMMVWRRPSPATWGFFAYALWYNSGQTYVSYALLQPYPYAVLTQELLESVAIAAGIAGFIAFALRFPDAGQPVRRIPAVMLTLLTVVLFVLQIETFATPFGSTQANAYGIAVNVLGVLAAVGVVVVLIVRKRFMMSADQTVEAQRMRLVYYALAVALPPFLLAEAIAQAQWMPWFVPSDPGAQNAVIYALFLPSGLIPIAVYQAVRKLRVVDVRFTALRATILGGIALLWIALFAAAEEQLRTGLESLPGIALLALLTVATALFERLREALNRACDVVCFPRLHRARVLIRETESTLADAKTADAIERLAVERPAVAMQLASAAIFRRNGSGYVRSCDIGWGDCAREIALDDARRLASAQEWPKGFPLDAAAPSVVVPIRRAGEIVALTLYGAHATGDDLVNEEKSLLVEFLQQVGPALRESLLLAKIAELEGR